MKIVNVEQMRQIEQEADGAGHSYAAMMDMAGDAVAAFVEGELLAGGGNVVILVGPGNNGGDGLVTARLLLEYEYSVTVYIWRREAKGDRNLQELKRRARRRSLTILWADNDPDYAHLRAELSSASVIVDALLGTGAARPIDGKLREILQVAAEVIQQVRQPPKSELPLERLRFPIEEALLSPDSLKGRYLDTGFDPNPEAGMDPFASEDGGDDGGAGLDTPWFPPGLDFAVDEDDDEDEDVLPQWPALPVVAVDCPSGLDCNTGAIDPAALPADATVTLGFPKWGQLQYPGAGACGRLIVAGIGISPDLAATLPVDLVGPAWVARYLPQRPPDAHKGTFGKVMVAAGSLNYPGAAGMAALGALRTGAGLVTLAVPRPVQALTAPSLLEATWLVLPEQEGAHSAQGAVALLEALEGYDVLLLGPGLSTGAGAAEFLDRLLGPEGLGGSGWQGRVVADADALNLLARQPGWASRLPAGTILTPHPGEMARLAGTTAGEVNAARIATALRCAEEWKHIVILKGPHTVVAAPDGRASVLPFANAILATAGSGDVMAGAVAGMLAQGLKPFEAAVCGAYLHGQVGHMLAAQGNVAGALPREFVQALPSAAGYVRALGQLHTLLGLTE